MLNHIGCPLGIGVYAGKTDEVFVDWQHNIRELAKCQNVVVKLGGMGMHFMGFGFEKLPVPPSSDDLVEDWKPYVETCIEAFGPQRAMFESNFPVDKRYYSYGVMWNAFKKLAPDIAPPTRPNCSSTPPNGPIGCRRRHDVGASQEMKTIECVQAESFCLRNTGAIDER